MSNTHLRLVHRANTTAIADEARVKPDLCNIQLPSKYGDRTALQVVLVPISDVSYHQFIRVLDEKLPCLIIETRPYPEFLYIFASMKLARAEFDHRGIEYKKITLQCVDPGEPMWKQLGTLKTTLSAHLQKHINSPVFILSSTNYTLDKMSKWLKSFISREVADARFDEIGDAPRRESF